MTDEKNTERKAITARDRPPLQPLRRHRAEIAQASARIHGGCYLGRTPAAPRARRAVRTAATDRAKPPCRRVGWGGDPHCSAGREERRDGGTEQRTVASGRRLAAPPRGWSPPVSGLAAGRRGNRARHSCHRLLVARSWSSAAKLVSSPTMTNGPMQ